GGRGVARTSGTLRAGHRCPGERGRGGASLDPPPRRARLPARTAAGSLTVRGRVASGICSAGPAAYRPYSSSNRPISSSWRYAPHVDEMQRDAARILEPVRGAHGGLLHEAIEAKAPRQFGKRVALADVAVAGVRPRGLDAERHQPTAGSGGARSDQGLAEVASAADTRVCGAVKD